MVMARRLDTVISRLLLEHRGGEFAPSTLRLILARNLKSRGGQRQGAPLIESHGGALCQPA
jgi:hypothetical protein